MLLPAISVALLMLLSSLSFQALALQQRAQVQLQFRQRQLEDQLQSAAHQLVGRLQRQHACLLPLPLAQWSAAPCVQSPEASLMPAGIELLHYQPSSDGAELLLRRDSGGAAAAFALRWSAAGAASVQLQRLHFQGLRGVVR